MLFLPVISPLNQTLWSQEERKWSATEKLLIVKQILLISTIGSVQRTVWRICILMLECKGLTVRSHRPKHHLLLLSHQVENFCPLRSGGHVSNDCEIPTDKKFPECPSKIAVSFQSCYWFYLIYVVLSLLFLFYRLSLLKLPPTVWCISNWYLNMPILELFGMNIYKYFFIYI